MKKEYEDILWLKNEIEEGRLASSGYLVEFEGEKELFVNCDLKDRDFRESAKIAEYVAAACNMAPDLVEDLRAAEKTIEELKDHIRRLENNAKDILAPVAASRCRERGARFYIDRCRECPFEKRDCSEITVKDWLDRAAVRDER